MSEHPAPAVLEALAEGTLSPEEAKPVVRHLLQGCGRCWEAVEPAAAKFLRGELPGEEREPDAYEFTIRHAYRAAQRHEVALARELAKAEREMPWILAGEGGPPPAPPGDAGGLRGWARCEVVLRQIPALRHQDPELLLAAASMAVTLAERLDPEAHPPGEAADLRARAWAEVANGRRLTGSLEEAEAAMQRALDHREGGTGDPLLRARLIDLSASLLTDQRRFAEAEQALDLAYRLYQAQGERSLAGKVLILRGIAAGYANDPRGAIRLLAAGLELLDPGEVPELVLSAVHSLAWWKIELGEYERARKWLRLSRRLYDSADAINLLKRRWAEGKIEIGLGNLRRAEATFEEVRKGFREHGMPYDLALSSLDLAEVWILQGGRTAEVRALADGLVQAFQALRIRREAIAALLIFQRAAHAEQATLAVVQTVAAELQRLEREPAEPRRKGKDEER